MLNKVKPNKGTLLIAEPFMADPNFKRSVVLLVETNEDDIIGYIINHESEMLLKDLISECWDADFLVYLGGPVANDTLHFIHNRPDLIPEGFDLGNDLYWGGDFETLKNLINNYSIKENEVRFFVGYSGWSKSQLKDEIASNSWIVSDKYDAEMVFDDTKTDLWKEAIISMGVKYAHIANFPEDPTLN